MVWSHLRTASNQYLGAFALMVVLSTVALGDKDPATPDAGNPTVPTAKQKADGADLKKKVADPSAQGVSDGLKKVFDSPSTKTSTANVDAVKDVSAKAAYANGKISDAVRQHVITPKQASDMRAAMAAKVSAAGGSTPSTDGGKTAGGSAGQSHSGNGSYGSAKPGNPTAHGNSAPNADVGNSNINGNNSSGVDSGQIAILAAGSMLQGLNAGSNNSSNASSGSNGVSRAAPTNSFSVQATNRTGDINVITDARSSLSLGKTIGTDSDGKVDAPSAVGSDAMGLRSPSDPSPPRAAAPNPAQKAQDAAALVKNNLLDASGRDDLGKTLGDDLSAKIVSNVAAQTALAASAAPGSAAAAAGAKVAANAPTPNASSGFMGLWASLTGESKDASALPTAAASSGDRSPAALVSRAAGHDDPEKTKILERAVQSLEEAKADGTIKDAVRDTLTEMAKEARGSESADPLAKAVAEAQEDPVVFNELVDDVSDAVFAHARGSLVNKLSGNRRLASIGMAKSAMPGAFAADPETSPTLDWRRWAIVAAVLTILTAVMLIVKPRLH